MQNPTGLQLGVFFQVKFALEAVCHPHFRVESSSPTQSTEFIPGLARYEPVYREEEEAFAQWYQKTPMGKKRAKILEGDDEDKGKDGKKKK